MIRLNDIPAQSKGFLIREIGDEIIIISEIGKEMHTLDELGSFIWKHINGKNAVSLIINSVCNEYDVKKTIAKKDIFHFINNLIIKKLVFLKKKTK